MINSINSAFVAMLNWIYSWVGNYGWSVVIFTLFIRIVILPMDIKSRKSMRDMNRIQPKVAALQKKYANDKEKLNQKTMELYKKENVSMAGGCLPLLASYPILILMFTAMRVVANEHTIKMILDIAANPAAGIPQMQGWLWIKNVFQPDSFLATTLPAFGEKLQVVSAVSYSKILTQENIDAARAFLSSDAYATFLSDVGMSGAFMKIPLNLLFFNPTITVPTNWAAFTQHVNGLFLLPLFAAGSQFIMTKVMTPTPKGMTEEEKQAFEASQANNTMNNGFMKWFFPLFSLWICATSNAAFSIYWMAVNVITIVQNLIINKVFDAQDAKKAALEGDKAPEEPKSLIH